MPANPATDVDRTRAKARDKSATRLAILDAARKLAEATGVDNLSLSAVAAEANFARATVYGYFRSKEELIQSVVAENLATVARAMRGEVELPEAEEPSGDAAAAEEAPVQSAEVVALPGVDIGPDIDEETEIVVAEALEAEDLQAEVEVAEAEAEVAPVNEAPVAAEAAPAVEETPDAQTTQRAHLEAILSKLTPNDPENSEGSAAAMARFDRRLRVFEKTLADIQAAQERTEKSGSTSSDTLAETLRGLNQRLEDSEKRNREIFAELRASTREAAWRLDKLEAATKNAPMPDAPHDLAIPVHVPVLPEAPVTEAKAEEPVAGEDAKPAEAAAGVTYLAAARESARAAMEVQQVKKPRPWLFRIPRKYLMLACALMSVVTTLVLVLVVQRVSAIEARAEEAPAKVASLHPRKIAMATALDELSAMASSGDGKAQLLIGMEYLHGVDGVQKNPVEAAKWIVRAAGRGVPMAQYWAGYVYQNGLGVSADPDEAMRWYEAAADQGNVKAMYNLGVGYAAGWTGAKDEPEAARWFARAARLGYLDAQFNLAVLYERGQGVPPNISDAYRWYAIAASSGDKESKSRLDAIAAQMNPDDLQAAQRSAMSFSVTPGVAAANALPSVELKRT